MSVLEEALQGEDLLVGFPAGGVEDWAADCEVMLLEGIRAWVLPVELVDLLPPMLSLYGRRARIGVGGLTDPENVTAAVAAGAHFLTSPIQDATSRAAAGDVAFLPGALTPAEVHAAVLAGYDSVQLVPAHVLGSAYSRALPGLIPAVDLLVTGRIERYQADMWWQSGARAACTEGIILQDERELGPSVNDPSEVRRRCQTYRQVHAAGR